MNPTFDGFAPHTHPPTILADQKSGPEALPMKLIQSRIMMLAVAMTFIIAGTHNTLGQNANSGEIKGTVTDASNAVVPGVDVTILEVGTGVVTTATTNGS